MTALDRELLGQLEARLKGLGRRDALAQLLSDGLLDRTACERAAMRRSVDRLVREGAGRTDAMQRTARTFSCSYGKVRAAVYRKP